MLYHLGPNPTVDIIVSKNEGNIKKILLIKRSKSASAEPNKWALPGGFINTDTPKGEVWKPGVESIITAAKRELKEETGLDLSNLKEEEFQYLGTYDSMERDPRNTNLSWISSSAIAINIPTDMGNDIEGADDAEDAKWFSIAEINSMKANDFAFDHYDIMKKHRYI